MPELPDIEAYLAALRPRVVGEVLERVRVQSISLLKSYDPPLETVHGREVIGLRRLGKRIVFCFDDELFLGLHLMVAGRLHWKPPGAKIPGRVGHAAFDFSTGTLTLTEAGTKKRAALHLLQGEESLAALDRGGVEVFDVDEAGFTETLRRERHTLKRTLTDPRIFSGIGGAYADEIMHRAKLSPLARSDRLGADEGARLLAAAREVLTEWAERLVAEAEEEFPENVTAFRDEMAVHGKFGAECPTCGATVQRIVYASNETNYCPGCQTDGKILADRALSRLLKDDWPRDLDEL